MCAVYQIRSQPAGVLDVTRQEFTDGACNCLVHTGPASQDPQIEAQVAQIERSRRCPQAAVMAVAGPHPDRTNGLPDLASLVAAVPEREERVAGVILLDEDLASGP